MNRMSTALLSALALLAAVSVLIAAEKPRFKEDPTQSSVVSYDSRDPRSPLDDTYNSTDTPLDIPDGPGGEVISTINVTDDYTVADIDVRVTITHTYTSDLQIYLRRTGGQEVRLFFHRGGAGDNITNCTFDDEAAQPISAGTAPFTGSFRPEQQLSLFDGQDVTGNWMLVVQDDVGEDVGTIVSWTLTTTRADANSGDVFGSITDAGNSDPLQFAHVSIVGLPGEQCTGEDGSYQFTLVPAGDHTLVVSREGYATHSTSIEVTGGETTEANAALSSWPDFEFEDYMSSGAAVEIVDQDTAFKTLVVSGTMIPTDVDITININHTYVGDLDIWVENAVGDRAQLTAHNGANNGVNYEQTRFDDDACTDIGEGTAPYTGSYIPIESLETLEGVSIQGTWRLIVYDFFAQDGGQIVNWSVHSAHFTEVSADDPRLDVPRAFSFDGNYPNPFNATTEFRFTVSRDAFVELALYNISGQQVAMVYSGQAQTGEHQVFFDASGLASGLYLATLQSGGYSETRKTVLLK